MKEHIFREYDIRGVVDEDLTDEVVYNLGRAFGTLCLRKYGNKITVGGDVRLSTERFRKSIIDGLLSTGAFIIWDALSELCV
jgi:phosphomannomutase/phosphoglucomutase